MNHFEKSRLSELIIGKRLLELTKIHKPVFSYFGSVYMTYLSVIQGLIMSVSLIYVIYGFVYKAEGYAVLLLPVLSFSVLLWHNYVMHHQIVGWQLCYVDTILIVLLGCTQVVAASLPIIAIEVFKADGNNISDFALWLISSNNQGGVFLYEFIMLIASAFIGLSAYLFSNRNLKKDYVKNIISKRYGLEVYLAVFLIEKKLCKKTLFSIIALFALFGVWFLLRYCASYNRFVMDQLFAFLLFVVYLVLIPIYDIKKDLVDIYLTIKG